ncbi:MAG: TolC family protein, partial [Gammaproteobacteria bacterium]|nr:TolC family protein [Gammaproteobacteria bacterium]
TGWGITITQPLLRGFGLAVNEADLHNAEDQQIIDNYTLANQVIDTITQITTDYYGVVEAEQTQAVDQAALVSSQKTLDNRRALFNAGRIAHADVVQAQLDLSSKQTIAAQDAQKVSQQLFDYDHHASECHKNGSKRHQRRAFLRNPA